MHTSVRRGDGVRRVDVGGKRVFEFGDLRPLDELTSLSRSRDRLLGIRNHARAIAEMSIVNFQTTAADVEAVAAIAARVGRAVDGELRPVMLSK